MLVHVSEPPACVHGLAAEPADLLRVDGARFPIDPRRSGRAETEVLATIRRVEEHAAPVRTLVVDHLLSAASTRHGKAAEHVAGRPVRRDGVRHRNTLLSWRAASL